MAALTISIMGGFSLTMDAERWIESKGIVYDELAKVEGGLDAAVSDVNLETFRRAASLLLPDHNFTWVGGGVTWSGPMGIAMTVLDGGGNYFGGGWTTASKLTLVSLYYICQMVGTDDSGGGTPFSEGQWSLQDGMNYILGYAQALRLALSGQEVGY